METDAIRLDIKTSNGTHVKVYICDDMGNNKRVRLFGEITHTGFYTNYFSIPPEEAEKELINLANDLENELLNECKTIEQHKTNKHSFCIGGMYKRKDISEYEINLISSGGERWPDDGIYKLLAVSSDGPFFKCLIKSPEETNPNYCYMHELKYVNSGQTTLNYF